MRTWKFELLEFDQPDNVPGEPNFYDLIAVER